MQYSTIPLLQNFAQAWNLLDILLITPKAAREKVYGELSLFHIYGQTLSCG
ncbi:hypothetical protein LSTR_LSTR010528 [Laodelphax striatellus]|uniref:Uncharacterized protein n=1 Tax=Laodelphax striatellus TaxID=195883 RepID=A0A482X3D1_LAOST|nr:hypothetical protein LSTR_LSTR010528 [Laodelphax striatellus]